MNLKPNQHKRIYFNTTTMTSLGFIGPPSNLTPAKYNFLLRSPQLFWSEIFRSPPCPSHATMSVDKVPKLQIVFKSQRKLSNVFCFKDRLPSDLVSGVVYKYTCGRCNSTYYGETDRLLKVRSAEHIGISPLTFKKTKPSKESAIRDHLLNCNNIPSFEEFTILTNGNNKFVLEIKESLLIKRDRPILNKNISSAKLFLFDNS